MTRYLVPAHALACLLFVVLGGCLATLNHTRLDVSALRLPGAACTALSLHCTATPRAQLATVGIQAAAVGIQAATVGIQAAAVHTCTDWAVHVSCLSRVYLASPERCAHLAAISPGTDVPIFGVRAHDTHHAIPNSNYGQYIMLWDWVMGTFRAHPQDPGSAESLREERVKAQ